MGYDGPLALGATLGKEFSYYLPTEVVYGTGVVDRLGKRVCNLGKRALVVTGRSTMRRLAILDRVVGTLTDDGIQVSVFDQVESDPSTETVDRGAMVCRKHKAEFVIGLGGGSAIDAAKGIAVAASNGGHGVWDFIIGGSPGSEVLGPGTLPIVAIPTTSGTGTEVTTGAVLRHRGLGAKECIGSRHIAPVLALVDPCLARSMPPSLTGATGLDALAQCIEACASSRSNAISDTLALRGVGLIASHLVRAVKDGDDLAARAGMALGATLSGMALCQAGVGAAHAISMVLGGRYGVQHGIGVGMFLAGTMRMNAAASPHKYVQVAAALGESVAALPTEEAAGLAVSSIQSLVAEVGLSVHLSELGVPREELREVAEAAVRHPDMASNPVSLTVEDVEELLEAAY